MQVRYAECSAHRVPEWQHELAAVSPVAADHLDPRVCVRSGWCTVVL